MDFEKLEPWQGKLAGIGAPTLLLWGADDPFAPLAGARAPPREIPGSKLVAFEGVGHFVFDEAAERSVEEVTLLPRRTEPLVDPSERRTGADRLRPIPAAGT